MHSDHSAVQPNFQHMLVPTDSRASFAHLVGSLVDSKVSPLSANAPIHPIPESFETLLNAEQLVAKSAESFVPHPGAAFLPIDGGEHGRGLFEHPQDLQVMTRYVPATPEYWDFCPDIIPMPWINEDKDSSDLTYSTSSMGGIALHEPEQYPSASKAKATGLCGETPFSAVRSPPLSAVQFYIDLVDTLSTAEPYPDGLIPSTESCTLDSILRSVDDPLLSSESSGLGPQLKMHAENTAIAPKLPLTVAPSDIVPGGPVKKTTPASSAKKRDLRWQRSTSKPVTTLRPSTKQEDAFASLLSEFPQMKSDGPVNLGLRSTATRHHEGRSKGVASMISFSCNAWRPEVIVNLSSDKPQELMKMFEANTKTRRRPRRRQSKHSVVVRRFGRGRSFAPYKSARKKTMMV